MKEHKPIKDKLEQVKDSIKNGNSANTIALLFNIVDEMELTDTQKKDIENQILLLSAQQSRLNKEQLTLSNEDKKIAQSEIDVSLITLYRSLENNLS